jgi:hypothetical protein
VVVVTSADKAQHAVRQLRSIITLMLWSFLLLARQAQAVRFSRDMLSRDVTFNSTLTALVCCIFVMFCLHQLQQAQDRIVLDSRTYVERKLLRRMRVM